MVSLKHTDIVGATFASWSHRLEVLGFSDFVKETELVLGFIWLRAGSPDLINLLPGSL